MPRTPALWLVAAALSGAAASAGEPKLSGSVKNLYRYQASPLTGSPYWLDLTRARLSLDAEAGVKLHLDYDHELRTGSFFNSAEYAAVGLPEPPAFLDMEAAISTGNSYSYRHRLYRAWASWEPGDWTLRFGRQRIAWGAGKLWNPTDVLNPYEPVSIEREERRGTDAFYLRRGIGSLGAAEAAYALGDRWASTDLLARVRGNRNQVDASLMGGKIAGSTASWMLGGDFAAGALEGSLHGEWSYTDPGTRPGFWRALAGYEYTFSRAPPVPWLEDAWVLAEYFHNGGGEADPRRYDPSLLLSGRETALGRDYAGFGFQRDLHPLVRLEVYAIVNLGDDSSFLGPSVQWNALKNFYLSAGLQRFGGSKRSEYGRLPNRAHLQGQYYF